MDNFVPTNEDGFATKALKYTVLTATIIIFTAASIIEWPFRHVAFAVAKIIQFFIPWQYSKGFDENILGPLSQYAAMSSVVTANLGYLIIGNFLPDRANYCFSNSIETAVEKIYCSEFLLNIHINGFPEESFQNPWAAF